MESKENKIFLEDFRTKGAKIFTGRDRGRQVRVDSRIDLIEAKYPEVHIIIPDNIYSINPSFFEELFINVVQRLGKEKFLEKFRFQSLGRYNYEKPLNEALDRLLRVRTAIG